MKRGPAFEIANAYENQESTNEFTVGMKVKRIGGNDIGTIKEFRDEDQVYVIFPGGEAVVSIKDLEPSTQEASKESAISVSQVPTAIDLARKALTSGDEESFVIERIMQVFGATEDESKEIVWEAKQKEGLTASRENSGEETQKVLDKGLRGFVEDYKQALGFGNEKLASIIKGNIDDIIKKQGLDEKEVYESASAYEKASKTKEEIKTELKPIIDFLQVQDGLQFNISLKPDISFSEFNEQFPEISEAQLISLFDSCQDNPKVARAALKEIGEGASKETAEAKLKVTSDLDDLWKALQGALPEGVTKEELTTYYDEVSRTFTLPEEWKDVLSTSGIEFTTEGNTKEEMNASLSISIESHPLEEIHAWETKLEELDIAFPISVDMQDKVVKWNVKDEDKEYVSEFLDNLGVEYENAVKIKATSEQEIIDTVADWARGSGTEDQIVKELLAEFPNTWTETEFRDVVKEVRREGAVKEKATEDRYTNPDGTFKEMTCPDNPDNKNAFCGCIRKMMDEGKSLESAKNICGDIVRKKG